MVIDSQVLGADYKLVLGLVVVNSMAAVVEDSIVAEVVVDHMVVEEVDHMAVEEVVDSMAVVVEDSILDIGDSFIFVKFCDIAITNHFILYFGIMKKFIIFYRQ